MLLNEFQTSVGSLCKLLRKDKHIKSYEVTLPKKPNNNLEEAFNTCEKTKT